MCNCGTTLKPKGYITEAKVIIRKIWENSKLQEKTFTVSKINKT